MSRATLSALLVLCAFSLACFHVGREFPTEPIAKLEIGSTTRDQVREIFGPPWRTGIEDGDETYTYGRYRYALFSQPRASDLVLRFDERGLLRSYTYNTTEPSP